MSKSNYLEEKLLDHVLGNTAYSVPGTVYLALSTADPLEDGSGLAEPVGNNYSRLSVTNNTTNWPNATLPGGVGTKTNGVDFTFANPSGSWGTVGWVAIMDASTSGNMLYYGALTASRAIDATSVPVKFLAGALVLTED